MEVKTNGRVHVNLNTLISVGGIVFLAGGGWVGFQNMQAALDAHLAQEAVLVEILNSLRVRADISDKRIDLCCPFYSPPRITPKDLVPPGAGGSH